MAVSPSASGDRPRPFSLSGSPLPGWGQALRSPGRTAIVLAAFAGFAPAGCQAVVPAATTSTQIATTSGPAVFRSALTLALRHLDELPRPASSPFHLVAFTGAALDNSGSSTPSVGSGWTFQFSRYADAGPTQSFEVATVIVPGVGVTQVGLVVSTDEGLSPIENWDAGLDAASPDSRDFLAPLVAKQLVTSGASISLARGVVTILASGHRETYSTVDGTFAAVS